jgi:DNA (cytosine-5)-methyltransferase 1
MWDVVRFTEQHRYRAVVVENVVEIADWGDADTCRGGLFQAWLMAMSSLGYRHRIVSLNSMHAQQRGMPAPQSRDRLYVVFWRKTTVPAPDLEQVVRPKAWCPSCDEVVDAVQQFKRHGHVVGRYRAQYVYRCPRVSRRGQRVEPAWLPAASIIDWSNLGVRIGDRAKPLAEKTMRRIQAGIDKYWTPLIVEAAGNTWDAASGAAGNYIRAWPATEPLRAVHTTESKGFAHHPLLVPVEGREGKTASSALSPIRTMTTRDETGVGFLRTATRASEEGSCDYDDRSGLVVPYYHNGSAKSTKDALPAVTTHDRCALLMRNNTQRGPDQSSMSTPVDEVARTITTTGHQSLLSPSGPALDINDVRFRMLAPDEIKQAMAFPSTYLLVGSRRQQVRLAGNAVTPPTARDIMTQVYAAITREEPVCQPV